MKIGIFHPTLNRCGGGEWVAFSIINSLRAIGHKVIVLTDEKIDQPKFIKTFGQKLETDGEIVFPFRFFNRGDAHNIYADIVGCFILKSKCSFVVDTFTRMLIPGVDVVYMHYPLLTRKVSSIKRHSFKSALYFLPYHSYQKMIRKRMKKIVFANSKFTSKAIHTRLNLRSHLLYPPLSPFFLNTEKKVTGYKRLNQVVSVSRFAPEKNLEMVIYIAKRLKKVKFLIVGNLHHRKVHSRLIELIHHFNLEKRVILLPNLPKMQLRQLLLNSKIYLHCAIDEHFGISVIDAMASGCLPIVHDSGGPAEFVPEKLRYRNITDAVLKIEKAILEWSPKNAQEMRDLTQKFNVKIFEKNFIHVLSFHGLLDNAKKVND